jgi:CRISPR-associated protein (TIGR03984 family)
MSIKIQPGVRLEVEAPQSLAATGHAADEVTSLWGAMQNGEEPVLLGFADDGLIWGRLTAQGVVTAHDADPALGPPLRWVTLQRLHLFSPDRELRIWREANAFRAARLQEQKDEQAHGYYEENQILLGASLRQGLSPVSASVPVTPVEDLAGQWHAPPIAATAFTRRGLRLRLRHYLSPDPETGMLYVAASRIVKLYAKGGQHGMAKS